MPHKQFDALISRMATVNLPLKWMALNTEYLAW